jgi:uncharacterized protein YndB with AHSA1/START domain
MQTDTRRVVDAYHQAWTARRFDEAIALLAPELQVEVPINEYPTVESFAAALTSFGSRAQSVDVLSAMDADDQAMILYDLDVRGLGTMRIVEHFTVADGKITRIRHIHDTAALRQAEGPPEPTSEDSYTADISIAASPSRVFSALTTLEGIAGWWTSQISGGGLAGDQLDLGFVGLDEQITMAVESVVSERAVTWRCDSHSGHPEWVGTRITFQIDPVPPDGSRLSVTHLGLVPSLNCYEQCFAGWEHFMRSIKGYAENDLGMPFDRR